MSERQAMLGQRVELRQKRQRQSVNCEALRDKLRGLLPVALDVAALDRDAVLDTAAVLHSALAELEICERQMKILNRELGE